MNTIIPMNLRAFVHKSTAKPGNRTNWAGNITLPPVTTPKSFNELQDIVSRAVKLRVSDALPFGIFVSRLRGSCAG